MPHIIVLHDIDKRVSYWAHITTETVEYTGKGAKIFVPATNVVDMANADKLLAVAASKASRVNWEGSVWAGAEFAEIEADLTRRRTREGMKIAKAKGRLRGKKPKLSLKQEAHLVALHRVGGHTTAELFGVARSTVYRALERAAAAAAGPTP